MTMVSTGPISIGGSATTGGLNQSINIEIGRSATATSSLNESALRALAGVPSGAISLSNFYGKTDTFSFTISTNQTNADLRTLAVNAGWDQAAKVQATIASGVYISANSTSAAGLTISGSFPRGVTLINNGFIVGMGGNAGTGGGAARNAPSPDVNSVGAWYAAVSGSAGGLALSVSTAVTINNASGTIGGGGGGGGGGIMGYRAVDQYTMNFFSGGGGGGGRTGSTNSSGGAGGPFVGTLGAARYVGSTGGAGTSSGGGSGGAGGTSGAYVAAPGGAGGGWGAAGSSGSTSNTGGVVPVAGYTNSTVGAGPATAGSGGSAGAAISGNSNITWISTGTRLGAIT